MRPKVCVLFVGHSCTSWKFSRSCSWTCPEKGAPPLGMDLTPKVTDLPSIFCLTSIWSCTAASKSKAQCHSITNPRGIFYLSNFYLIKLISQPPTPSLRSTPYQMFFNRFYLYFSELQRNKETVRC